MPYIKRENREWFDLYDTAIDMFGGRALPGNLNFAVTRLIVGYIRTKGKSYVTLNEVIGVLECVKQELYRRLAVPYEDRKRTENGDVFDG